MIIEPICFYCKNYKEKRKCKAFNKIPDEIFINGNDHTEQFKDDNGIRFEEIKNKRTKNE